MEPGVSKSTCVLPRREVDACVLGLVAVNETILVDVCVNSVSMPSALPADAEGGCGLLAVFAGSVNERRMLGLEDAGGACSGVLGGAGEDMAEASLDHCCRKVVVIRVAWRYAKVTDVPAVAAPGKRMVEDLACGGWRLSVRFMRPPPPRHGFTMDRQQGALVLTTSTFISLRIRN